METLKEEMSSQLKEMIKESFDDFMKKDKDEQIKMFARYIVGTACLDRIIEFIQSFDGYDDFKTKKDELVSFVLTEANKHMVAGLSLGYTVEKNEKNK